MALAPTLGAVAANASADAVAALCSGGYLRIYDSTGTGKPASADTAVTTQVLLAELRFGTPAFAAAVAGVATANSIASDLSANHTGTATWFQALKSDGTTSVFDGTVGTAGCDLNLTDVAIVALGVVAVTALTYTAPES